MAEHTPGPWHVGGSLASFVFDAKSEPIADPAFGRSILETQANARLIAAAPALLAALEVADHALRLAEQRSSNAAPSARAARSIIADTVAKATGKDV